MNTITPVNRERTFSTDEVIVSKTDTRGVITYANEVFAKVAGYKEEELLGKPHSIVRHPDMPRCVFKYLWDTIGDGQEVFAYVKNMAKTGEYYWVYAHVTPTYDDQGDICGYHSSRRCPDRASIATIEPIYKALLKEEQRFPDSRKGMEAGFQLLVATLHGAQKTYEEFVWTITPSQQ